MGGFEGVLNSLLRLFTGPAAIIIVTLAIVILGLRYIFGDHGAPRATVFTLIGLALVLGAQTIAQMFY